MNIDITLTASEVKVLAKLLAMAVDEFSGHGCNDFDLIRDGGLAPGEAEEFVTILQVENPDRPETFDGKLQSDVVLLGAFRGKLERALKTPPKHDSN